MIIGAAKSGTSSLVQLLHAAPRVAGNPSAGEIGYFLRDDEFGRGVAEARAKYFDSDDPDLLRVGKSAGLMYSEAALARLAADSPGRPRRRRAARTDRAGAQRLRCGRSARATRPRTSPPRSGASSTGATSTCRVPSCAPTSRAASTPATSTGRPSCSGRRCTSSPSRSSPPTRSAWPTACSPRSDARWARCRRSAPTPTGRAPSARNASPGSCARAACARRCASCCPRAARPRSPGSRTGSTTSSRTQQREQIDPATRALLAEHFAPWNERLDALLGRPTGWR